MNTREKAHEIRDYVIKIREQIHENPELSYKEFNTTKLVASELDKMGIPYTLTKPTGLYADIKGGKPGKTIALRADMDALNQNEHVDVPFKSKVDGVMHACGHDCHTSMLLGAAKILSENKDEIPGTVRLIFQPGEEIALGAKMMIEEGALKGVDAIYGQHIFGGGKAGTLSTCDNGMMACCDQFKITVHGKAAHGSMPQAGIDATVCGAAIVMNLESLVSREYDPQDPLVLTIGKADSGTRWNIVSGEATLEGTVRCVSTKMHKEVPEAMKRIAEATAAAYRCTVDFQYDVLTEVTNNDPAIAAYVREAAKKVVDSPEMYSEMKPLMGSEDFSFYTVHVPAAFAALGGGGTAVNHSDLFCIDESALEVGVAMNVQVALDYLNGNA
ncbi:MAG: M20 metallopeptidase family protein [Oscillospiraceae bacterium]